MEAADAIRKRRAKLEQAGNSKTLEGLEAFLADINTKVGAKSLGALVKAFGKEEGEDSQDEDNVDVGDVDGEGAD
jgi:hypothetical protein